MPNKTSIHYLFPPDRIGSLPTWRFVLHFQAPKLFRERKTRSTAKRLQAAEWKIVRFPFGLDEIPYDSGNRTVAIRVEVSEEDRSRPNALADYESDVWKIYGNMLPDGFGDLYYEAVDWIETD